MSSCLRQPRTHGFQDIGESSAQCAVREGEEETGTIAEVAGLLGVYSPPGLVVYDDGEIRQAFEVTHIGKPVGGKPNQRRNNQGVLWPGGNLEGLDIHISMRRQIGHFLNGEYPHIE